MINVVDVTQHYGVRPVLREVSIQIQPHTLTAILGPNGMGKSTLLSVVAGILSPQKGFVEIDGLRRRRSADEELEIRRRVAYLPDHPWLPIDRTGREFLVAMGELYDVEPDRMFLHIDRLLEIFDLERHGDQPIRSYSNGQKKKIAICSALVTDAPVMLLDEPFAGGLDPSGIMALKSVLGHLAKKKNHTVLITAPMPELVEEVAKQIVILADGVVVAHDTLTGLRQQTGCNGRLAEVLSRMTHPEMEKSLERYFEATSA